MAIDASLFDSRDYPTASAAGGYGEWAATYEETVAVGLDAPLLARLTRDRLGRRRARPRTSPAAPGARVSG